MRRLAPALWQATAEGRALPGYVPFLLALARWEGLIQVEEDELVAHEPALEAWRGLIRRCSSWRMTRWKGEEVLVLHLQIG